MTMPERSSGKAVVAKVAATGVETGRDDDFEAATEKYSQYRRVKKS